MARDQDPGGIAHGHGQEPFLYVCLLKLPQAPFQAAQRQIARLPLLEELPTLRRKWRPLLRVGAT